MRDAGGSSSSPDEFCSSDEVKVFKDEGEDASEQTASHSLQAELLEDKSSLITESEQVGFFLFLSLALYSLCSFSVS